MQSEFYKLIIAGSRTFTDYHQLTKAIENFKERFKIQQLLEVVSGTARGADRLGEKFALMYDHKLTKMPADWDTHGRSAGYRRNEEMAQYADGCIVCWDGSSSGSKHMIDLAKSYKLQLLVLTLKPEKNPYSFILDEVKQQ